jgi:YegS/Rv2252/BmrU family lipid kinase
MLTLIVNPAAGGGRAGRLLPTIAAELRARGLAHRVEATTSLAHARELARAAAAAGELAVAMGGDGLVGAVAGALMGTTGTLGVLPGGRGNDFARVLRIPRDPLAACAVLTDGAVRSLDLGSAGTRTFIGIASCGFDSDANRIANEARLVRGSLVYAYAAARALIGWRPATFTIRIDGGEARRFRGYSVAAANSAAFGGGMYLAPQAELDDGLLDVVTIADAPRLQYLRLLPTAFKGTHIEKPVVRIERARELEISADRPFTLYADGDPLAELPVTVKVHPGAVRVMAPR